MKAKASSIPALADKGQIKRIHVLGSRLELPDLVYRKWLNERYGVASSKQLTIDQAGDFIQDPGALRGTVRLLGPESEQGEV